MKRSSSFRLPGPTRGLSIGVMGGTFDPPHSGHAHVIETARKRLGLDWVWVLPARGNPLKTTQTPFSARLALARDYLSGPRTRVSPMEEELGLTYTIDVLRTLKRLAPDARFVWLMGADNLANFHHWRDWRGIAALAPIAVVSRPGSFPHAGLSRFARQYAACRQTGDRNGALARARPPAWRLLQARLDPASSTELRDRANPAANAPAAD